MDGFYNKLLDEFGVNAGKLKKIKGFTVAACSDKTYLLKKSFDSPERISFQYDITQNLCENGFSEALKYYKTRSGKPYAMANGDVYVLTDYVNGEEADFDDDSVFDLIIEGLAAFHEKSQSENLITHGFYADDIRHALAKAETELISIKRKIAALGNLSDFDLTFLKNCDYFIAGITEARSILDTSGYDLRLEKARKTGSICHKLFKKENLTVSDNKLWISGFSGCEIDYFASDLAMLISRYIKYSKQRKLSVRQIIDKYSRFKPVDKGDYAIILAHLLYPQWFLSPVRKFYNKKRTWAPSSVAGKLDEALALKEASRDYINNLRDMLY